MNLNSKKIKIIAILIPVLVLLSLAVKPIDTIMNGKEIKLKAKIDSFDSNEKLIGYLSYEIEKTDLSAFSDKDLEKFKKEFPYGERVYIYLKESENGIYELDKISFSKESGNNLFISGRINYYEDKNMEEAEKTPEEYNYKYEDIKNVYLTSNLKYSIEQTKPIKEKEVLVKYKIKNEYTIYSAIEDY